MFKYLVYALIAATLALVFTKPTETGVEALLKQQTLATIQGTDVNLADMGVDGAMVTLCKLQPNACWDVMRGLTEITYDDRYLYARVGVEGLGDPRTCYALARSLFCL